MGDQVTTPVPGYAFDQIVGDLESALNEARFQAKDHSSRELSLAITKLDEARLWLGRVEVVREGGDEKP